MCVLLHLLIYTALRTHIIVVEALYKLLLLLLMLHIYHVLTDVLGAHTIHVKFNTAFYALVEQSPANCNLHEILYEAKKYETASKEERYKIKNKNGNQSIYRARSLVPRD